MSTALQLQSHLDNLRGALPEVRGALVASIDGMPISHNLAEGDPNRMAAMVATALSLGKRLIDSFTGGQFQETTVFGQTAQIFVYAAGPKAVLAVTSNGASNIGLLHLEARSVAQKIAQVLL